MAPSVVFDVLEGSVSRHGSGVIFMILETLSRCHVIKADCSADGLFMNAFVDKRSTQSSASTFFFFFVLQYISTTHTTHTTSSETKK